MFVKKRFFENLFYPKVERGGGNYSFYNRQYEEDIEH